MLETPEKEPFSFSEQLEKGKKGEDAFHAKYPKLERLSGMKGEFRIPKSGRLIELKTDYYCIEPEACGCGGRYVPNCFIEMGMDDDYFEAPIKSGIHQAVEHGCEAFVYYFIRHDFDIWFRSEELRDFAVEWEKKHGSIQIRNQNDHNSNRKYSASGVLIPRDLLIRELAVKYPNKET